MPKEPRHSSELPADTFKREYPTHAARASESVSRWYHLAVNQFTLDLNLLRKVTGTFLQVASQHPEDVYIHGTPLSFALEGKRTHMLEHFKHISPAEYIGQFADWFNTNLTNDNNPQKKTAIESIATIHVFQWLSQLPQNLKNDTAVWDEVDKSIASALEHSGQNIHPAGEVLLFCIHAAVIEQFISDHYAPDDLFGLPTKQ